MTEFAKCPNCGDVAATWQQECRLCGNAIAKPERPKLEAPTATPNVDPRPVRVIDAASNMERTVLAKRQRDEQRHRRWMAAYRKRHPQASAMDVCSALAQRVLRKTRASTFTRAADAIVARHGKERHA
jgi:hypothetical protein